MSKTHWKKLFNSDYLGAYSLMDESSGRYSDVAGTIASIRVESVMGPEGRKEDRPVIRFKESMKPMVLNSTNAKVMEKLFKTPIYEDWAGRRIQIGVESVKAFGDVTDALRVRKFLPKDEGPSLCADCGCEVVAAGNMSAVQLAAYAKKRYGRLLCAECMRRLKEAADKQESDSTAPQETAEAADE